MRNFLLCLLLALGWGAPAGAQSTSPTPSVGNPLKELRAALSGLDANRMPTGILMDRVMLFTNPTRFAGQGDTAASYPGFEQQYWEYYHASHDTTGLLPLDSLRARSARMVQQQDALPLLMLSYRYNALLPTAAQDQLITIDSVHAVVTDGPDLRSSPYRTEHLFSVALPLPAVPGVAKVYVGPEFWLGNTPVPEVVYIDFGDGQGVQPVSMGSTVAVTVGGVGRPGPGSPPPGPAVSGVGTGQAIQVGYDDFSTRGTQRLLAATALRLLATASIEPDMALGIKATSKWPGFTPVQDVVSGPNGEATGIAWIKYADDNPALPDGSHVLRRPLVFVEGIDFPEYRNNNGASGKNHAIIATGPLPLSDFTTGSGQQFGGYRNGTAGWNEVVDYNIDYKSLEKFPDLREQLQAPRGQTGFANGIPGGGYDLIYFDFSDGASLIQHNAMALITLLEWINFAPNRALNAEETIVIGASMGGQVARFALAYMEQQGRCHNSKLYVSFDSPHRGANVPIGLQLLFDRLQGASSSAEEIVQTKLRREATEQMVVFHFADEAVARRTAWQAWQASPGSYPSLLRKVAVANGSGQAAFSPDMSPGMLMLRTSINPFNLASYSGNHFAYALGRSDRLVFLYRPPFTLFAQAHSYTSDPSWGNYDVAPGCRERTAGDAQDVSDHNLVSGGDYNTFMPTISTLDVQDAGPTVNPNFGYNVSQEINPSNKPNRAKYAFDAYYAAGAVNEPHVQITNGQGSAHSFPYNTSYFTDNSTWIQNELQESAHRLPSTLPFTPPTQLTPITTYNYGSVYRHLLPSVQLHSGGQLYINKENLAVSGGTAATQAAPLAGSFEVFTSTCGTVVQVYQGAQLTVGGDNAHPATARFLKNSLLDVQAGGQLTVSAGSVLHIERGATLVLRSQSTLALNGQLVVDAGGFICVEDPTGSIVTGASGQLSVNASAYRYANPALNATVNVGTLNCQYYPACQSEVNFSMQETQRLAAGSPGTKVPADSLSQPNFNDCVHMATFTASGTGLATDFRWTVNGQYQPSEPSHPEQMKLLLRAGLTYDVKVTVTGTCDGTVQTAEDDQVRGTFPNCRVAASPVAMYPNPATGEVNFAPATDYFAGGEYTVSLYDGQGALRWHGRSAGGRLHVACAGLPRGIYGAVITQGDTVVRRNLSLE